MATDYLYPFNSTEELKSVFSEIYIAADFDSLKSSFVLAGDEIKDVISVEMWDKMLEHYNSGNYEDTGTDENIRQDIEKITEALGEGRLPEKQVDWEKQIQEIQEKLLKEIEKHR